MLSLDCLVPWSVAHEADLLRFVPWTVLQCQPANLQQPDRFEHWSVPDMVGVRPGPGEELLVTTDGLFCPASVRAGWGRPCGETEDQEGVFVGCLWGSGARLLSEARDVCPSLDSFVAEVAGLLWGALAVIQLRVSCPVIFALH